MNINYIPIGTIHTPFTNKVGMPIQFNGAVGTKGTITIYKEFTEGLTALDGFSHIYLIYHFHKSEKYTLMTKAFLDDKKHGVFATRAPQRPNAIGISIVKLIRIEGNTLHIQNTDILNNTPLLDIKPYVPAFDIQENCKTGWIEGKNINLNSIKSDKRFS